jgi:hypothetical protein
MMASYPTAVFSGVHSTNGETIYAADPNTISSELSEVEAILGLNPQIESQPVTGAPVNYGTLSSRVSAAMRNTTHPYVDLQLTKPGNASNAFTVGHFTNGQSGTLDYAKFNPPYGIAYQPPYANALTSYVTSGYITIRDTGLWYVDVSQVWQAMETPQGYVKIFLNIDGNLVRESIFNYGQFQTGGSNAYGETYANQNGYTHTSFLGVIKAGATVRVMSGNSTPIDHINVLSSTLRAYMLRPFSAIYDLEVG